MIGAINLYMHILTTFNIFTLQSLIIHLNELTFPWDYPGGSQEQYCRTGLSAKCSVGQEGSFILYQALFKKVLLFPGKVQNEAVDNSRTSQELCDHTLLKLLIASNCLHVWVRQCKCQHTWLSLYRKGLSLVPTTPPLAFVKGNKFWCAVVCPWSCSYFLEFLLDLH